ncbi:MAG: hypothetical protein V4710_20480 [Verrucomicrobiota bacterium]
MNRRIFLCEVSKAAALVALHGALPRNSQGAEAWTGGRIPQNDSFSAGTILQSNEGATVVQAITLELTEELAAPDRDLFIFAYEVRIKGIVRLPGKNLFVHARRIIVSEGAELDVSGKPAVSHTQRAADGPALGAPGSIGAKGNDGGNAGRIHLVADEFSGPPLKLSARGGNGATGQEGGHGMAGAAGGNGGKNQAGGKGGAGGNGGTGGQGGKGGDMGSALVNISTPGKMPVRFDLSAGSGGGGGKPGEGRPGGGGGAGGEQWETYERSDVLGPGR